VFFLVGHIDLTSRYEIAPAAALTISVKRVQEMNPFNSLYEHDKTIQWHFIKGHFGSQLFLRALKLALSIKRTLFFGLHKFHAGETTIFEPNFCNKLKHNNDDQLREQYFISRQQKYYIVIKCKVLEGRINELKGFQLRALNGTLILFGSLH